MNSNHHLPPALPVAMSLALLGAVVASAGAQTGTFQPGTREIFSLDPVGLQPSGLPKGITLLTGKPQFVDKDGVRMLKSVGPLEFLIQLTEPLPARFTLEFDVVSRNTNLGGPEFAFEGTAVLSRSPRSGQVVWGHQGLAIYGGGIDREFKLPEGMGPELMGQLAELRVAFDGPASKLLTNGEVVYDLPNLPFPRGRVLRIFMHGVDESEGAFYLARLRIAEGGGLAATTTASAGTGSTSASGVTAPGGGVIQSTTGVAGRTGPATVVGPGPVITGTTSAAGTPTTIATIPVLVTDIAPPPAAGKAMSIAPTSVQVTLTGPTSVKVTWDPVGPYGAQHPTVEAEVFTHYVVDRWLDGSAAPCPTTFDKRPTDTACQRYAAWPDVGEESFEDGPLESGSTYRYRVAAAYRYRANCNTPGRPNDMCYYWNGYPAAPVDVTPPLVLNPLGLRTTPTIVPPRVGLTATVSKTYATNWAGSWTGTNDRAATVTWAWQPVANAAGYLIAINEIWNGYWDNAENFVYFHRETVSQSPAPTMVKEAKASTSYRACVAVIFDLASPPDPHKGECLLTTIGY